MTTVHFRDTAAAASSEKITPPSAPVPSPIGGPSVKYLTDLGGPLLGDGWLSGPNVTVTNASGLVMAVKDVSISRIFCEDGHYLLSETLNINRDLYIGALVTGAVVIDAHNQFRVLGITAGFVQLVGLNMTGGNVDQDDVSVSLLGDELPRLALRSTPPSQLRSLARFPIHSGGC